MDVWEIVKIWLKENGFDGLCNEDCGCGLDYFAPCEGGPSHDCESARMRILGPNEYLGDCGPGDNWFEPSKSTILEIGKNMTNGELMDMLIDHAKDYVPDAIASIKRNTHMTEYQGEKISQSAVDALIVDFVNFIAARHGMDLGLYTKYLREEGDGI